jgi:hypothetical protein
LHALSIGDLTDDEDSGVADDDSGIKDLILLDELSGKGSELLDDSNSKISELLETTSLEDS